MMKSPIKPEFPGIQRKSRPKSTRLKHSLSVFLAISQLQFSFNYTEIMSDSPELEASSRKRRRPALSCEQCRRRKVRCDRNMPCGPCKKVYGSIECSYVHEGKAALKARHDAAKTSVNGSPPSPETQQGVLDAQIGGGGDRAQMAQMECTIRALQERVQCLEQSGQGNSSQSQSSEIKSSSGTTGSNSRLLNRDEQITGNRHDGTRQQQTLIPPPVPRLKGSGEKTRLFGTTHWAIVFQQVIFFYISITSS